MENPRDTSQIKGIGKGEGHILHFGGQPFNIFSIFDALKEILEAGRCVHKINQVF